MDESQLAEGRKGAAMEMDAVEAAPGDEGEQQTAAAPSAVAAPVELSSLVYAGRLESVLSSRPSQIRTASASVAADVVAWSVDNLLAIADCASQIKLVHLSSPSQTHSIGTEERPYLLQFSPRGDALLAAFRASKTVCLWTRSSGALNEWKLKQKWSDWQGRVLDVKWIGGDPREWSADHGTRRAARGPQFAAERSTRQVGALVVCEGGQITLFHGSIEEEGQLWQTLTLDIPIPTGERIARAAIGLVADEPLALVAFTLRMSSKASVALPGSTAEGDALGMFFEGTDGVVGLDEQQSVHIDDGQDKVELMELRFDVAPTPSSAALRPLAPVYLASYEEVETPLPFAASLSHLLWMDVATEFQQASGKTGGEPEGQAGGGEAEGSPARMKLFGAFYADAATTLRVWELQREDVEVLSGAFAKLESAKSKTGDEERDDWVAKSAVNVSYPNYIGNHYQLAPASDHLFCTWTHAPKAHSLSSIGRSRLEHRLIEADSLQVLDGAALPTAGPASNTPAISPSGFLAALVIDRNVSIIQTAKQVRRCKDDAVAYKAAVIQGRDVSDLLRTCECNVQAVGQVLDSKHSVPSITRLIELGARVRQPGSCVGAKNSRLLLELIRCFSLLNSNDRGSYFDQSQLWSLLSSLEWVVWLLETMARQAYLEHASTSVSSPPRTNASNGRGEEEQADVLALLTHDFPRMLLTHTIVLLVRFSNWLHRVSRSKDEVRGMLNNADFRDSLKANSRRMGGAGADESGPGSRLWTLADNLRLAQMRVKEVMLKTPIDLSQSGRLLRAYTRDEQEKAAAASGPSWWAALETGNRTRLAKALVDGHCIRTALFLFCPAEGEEDRGQRDVLTKAQLVPKSQRFACLACNGQTQLPLKVGDACVCSSRSWWSIMQ